VLSVPCCARGEARHSAMRGTGCHPGDRGRASRPVQVAGDARPGGQRVLPLSVGVTPIRARHPPVWARHTPVWARHTPVRGACRRSLGMTVASSRQNAHLTFKGTRGVGRHAWLRLTPAYSVRLVRDHVARTGPGAVVTDPFSGT